MTKSMLVLAFLWAACSHGWAVSGDEAALGPEPNYATVAKRFARYFPEQHLTRRSIDDFLSSQAWTNYLAAFDFERVYFLSSDIEDFRFEELALDDKLKDGDLTFAYKVFQIFKDRVKNRCEYVNVLLQNGFDFEKQESYRWKRKDLPWPGDEAEWNEIWRKKIKNEYLRQVIARQLGDAESQDDKIEKEEQENRDSDREPDVGELILKRHKQTLTILEDTDSEWVLQKYMSAFAHAYDPHSDYLSHSAVEDFNIEMKLSLVGIGALLRSEDGAAKVVRTIPGGPADRDAREKKLSPGDKIIAVAQGDNPPVDIMHWPLYKVVQLIRGKKGTKVVLTVVPASDPSGSATKLVDLIRDEVKLEEQAAQCDVKSILASDGVTRNLGVITLPTFYANMSASSTKDPTFRSAAHDVENILDGIKDKGVEGILLDLRNNGGGSLLEAIRMTGLFITTGPTVQVKEKKIKSLYDNNPMVAYEGPLVILVNRLSASASEILAGALQDYGRAVVVGDSKTHGKGTVQTILELGWDKDLGSVKITTASYYRITGSSTQSKGVSPDIVLRSSLDYLDLGEDSLPNAIPWSMEKAVAYSPAGDLRHIINALKKKSAERRNRDDRFARYAEIMTRIEEMNRTEEVPLDIGRRTQMAQIEKQLSELQIEPAPEDEAEGKDDKRRDSDLVLEESLRILADLTALSQDEHKASVTARSEQPSSAAN